MLQDCAGTAGNGVGSGFLSGELKGDVVLIVSREIIIVVDNKPKLLENLPY